MAQKEILPITMCQTKGAKITVTGVAAEKMKESAE